MPTSLPKTNQSGFTLIELLLTTIIVVFVLATAYSMWDYFTDSFYYSYDEGRELVAANQTISQLSREIRELSPSETGSYPLVTVNDQELAFYSDTDNDGQIERVRYWLDGNLLNKGIIEPTGNPAVYPEINEAFTTLIGSVQNADSPLFLYYNQNWPSDTINNPITPADRLLDTRLITIQLKIGYADSQDSQPVEVQTSVNLRGLKSNL